MDRTETQELINSYVAWLKERISFESIENYAEITTPFLDRNNDRIQIYVRRDGNRFLLTDDSYTLHDLRVSGLQLDRSERRRRLLQTVLNGFGVEKKDDQLFTYATMSNIGQKKHNLIQSMLAVNDLFVLAEPTVKSLFLEDVEMWLKDNEVRFSRFVRFPGKSGFDHNFDFLIPASKKKPERLVRAINTPDKRSVSPFLWAFSDVRVLRENGTAGVAILNDSQGEIDSEVLEALNQYDLISIPWSDRKDYIDEVAA